MKVLIALLKGALIGISFLVPGLSGGTMMLILNVFDDAVHALNELLHFRLYRIKYYMMMSLGVVIGILTFAGFIDYLLINFNMFTMSFFLGVIVSGLFEIEKQISNKVRSVNSLLPYCVGFFLSLGVYLLPSLKIELGVSLTLNDWIMLIIIGIPLSVALILPGLSTSYLLLVFGLYERTLNAISNFNLFFLLPLVLGVLLGTLLFTKLIDTALQNYPNLIYKIIFGLVLGSIYGIVQNLGISGFSEGLIAIMWASIGFLSVTYIKFLAQKVEMQGSSEQL